LDSQVPSGLGGAVVKVMLDCFLRTSIRYPPLRKEMFQLTVARWALEPVRITTCYDVGIRSGRVHAERLAVSDIYIYTDDDVMPVGKNWVERGLKIMEAHPEYAVCSTLSLIEGENLAKGDGDIYPMHMVGAPMWIRRGILTDLPEMDLNNECGKIHSCVVALGFKEGLLSNSLRHMHLGHGFSSNPGLHWGY
jgi:hypothetical protein